MVEGPVRDTRAMIAGMRPALTPGLFVFCAAPADMTVPPPDALAAFREEEGLSLILPLDRAREMGLATDPAMRRITLCVLSDLEGVGLTAAVATALAEAGIPANVVAALRHDHVFVPAAMADTALAVLETLAASEEPDMPPTPASVPTANAATGPIRSYDDLKAFALSLGLPEVTDTTAWGRPCLKAHGKMWAWWSPYVDAAVFKADKDEREMLIAADPETFFLHPHYAAHDLVLVRAGRIDPGWARARLVAQWRAAAPKRWLKAWDAAQGDG